MKSLHDWTGRLVNGVVLGDPVIKNGFFVWDHSTLPDYEIDADGNVVNEKTEVVYPVSDFVGRPSKPTTDVLKADEVAKGVVEINEKLEYVDDKGAIIDKEASKDDTGEIIEVKPK